MKRAIRYYRIIWLKHDLAAGLSVFFVALPLCLGIALASGAPVHAGLISGIVGGLVVALLSGSQLSVSGPAAGLTALVATSILSLGDYRIFLLAVIVAGLFQVLLGLLKLGVIAHYFPSSVIKGMLAAIGILLISKQIPLALGYDQPDFWTTDFLNIFYSDDFADGFESLNQIISEGALLVALISIAILVVFQSSVKLNIKAVPVPLLVVLVGILANFVYIYFIPELALKDSQKVEIPSNIFNELTFPDFSKFFSTLLVWKYGILIGLLASLETLLCIEAIDKLDKRNRITPVNRELVAQGIGNVLCGMLGAIPLTAVVVRGAANVNAGGRTKLSAFTHGLFLLLSVLLIPFVLNAIPYASLAAILMIVGYNLARPQLFVEMWKLGWKQFLPFLITIVVILATDLLMGVSIGLLISIYFIIQNNFRAEYKVNITSSQGVKHYYIKLHSHVTFLNKAKLRKIFDEIPEGSELTVDGSDSVFVDYDILEIIGEYHNKAGYKNIKLNLIGIEKVNTTALH
jgi:MFS superfamily sulfate permease-like transporter